MAPLVFSGTSGGQPKFAKKNVFKFNLKVERTDVGSRIKFLCPTTPYLIIKKVNCVYVIY